MQHVAHNRHRQIAEVFFVVADGVHVEQPLRRVRMATVACIDDMHMRCNMLRDQMRRARLAVAHHKNIGSHRTQVGDGVEQRFAFASRGTRDIEVEHICRQTRGSNFKGRAGAGAVLEEQVEHAFAAQQRHFLHFTVVD